MNESTIAIVAVVVNIIFMAVTLIKGNSRSILDGVEKIVMKQDKMLETLLLHDTRITRLETIDEIKCKYKDDKNE